MEPRELIPFLSDEQTRAITARVGGPAAAPQTFDAAFLFFDINGFTRLSDRLSSAGVQGVEELYRIISGIFGPLADLSMDHGGDVLYFAGDGVGVLFRAPDADLAGATHRAAHAALRVLDAVGATTPFPDLVLRVRASIGVGAATSLEVGGVDDRWMLAVDGEAVLQARAADVAGRPTQLTVSADAWAHLAPHARGQAVDADHWRVVSVGSPPSPPSPGRPQVSEEALASAVATLPPALVHGMRAGDAQWVAEMRTVTSVFIAIPDADADPVALQRALVICQEEMRRVDGVVHEILGDKGSGFLCVTGLPPHAHEDDATRACDAASAIHRRLAGIGLTAGIGVESGSVHCGIVGSDRRRQYEMYGVSMSLAARLMQACAGDGVLVGPAARRQAADRLSFGDVGALRLKGFPEPVPAHRVLGRRRERRRHGTDMVGRHRIQTSILDRIDALREHRAGGAFLLEAEAGMGKSMLLERVLAEAADRVRTVFGAADSMEQRTSLFALRGVLADLFALRSDQPVAERERHVRKHFEAMLPERAELAPLLNALLPVDLPETALTEQLSGIVRAENLVTVLVELFAAATAEEPLLVVLEDLHWMDAGSWSVVGRLVDDVDALLVFGTLRPMLDAPPQLASLSTGEGRERVPLAALGRQDTERIVARALGVDQVAPSVVDAVYTRSEGIPFYTQEITWALREARAIRVHGTLADVATSGGQLDLPTTVTGVITGRIDRLPAAAQLSLKVASVLGRHFTLAGLVAIHPTIDDLDAGRVHADQLIEAALVVVEDDRLSFRHALTHETTYGLLTPSQRVSLHRAAAERLEADDRDLAKRYARLVEHWSRAGEQGKAATYAGLAGEQALSVWANRTAIQFLEQALELDERARGALAVDLHRARWHRMLGDAWWAIPDNDEALHHYQQSFVRCGFPEPRFGWRTPLEVVRHLIARVLDPAPDRDPEVRQRCITALQAFDNLSVLFLWSGDQMSLVHLVFAADNLARRSGPSAEAALSRNMTGYSLLLAGLPGVGMNDMLAAWKMADDVGDLHARIVTNVFVGLSRTATGQTAEALPYLQRGWKLSREMGAGLWLHRADYMLAENHLVCGRYRAAIPYFRSCAEVARGAEPHTTGFANASALLCRLRLGDDPAVLVPVIESADAGVPMIRAIDHNFGMQLTFAMGVQMEIYLRLGRYAEVLELAEEELSIVDSGDDTYSYFRGSEAHTQTALVLHALWERSAAGAPGTDDLDPAHLKALAARAVAHLRRGSRIFPAVKSRYLLMRGVHERLLGKHRASRATLRECITYATAVGFPWEITVANVELARLSEGAERTTHWEEARRQAAKVGLVWEVGDTPSIGLGAPVPS
jgi:class 3 adenylate cyclase/tetratricopeptide (TPR) repeat protein